MSTATQYRAGEREFVRWLTGYGIKLGHIADLGRKRSAGGWEHFAWELTVTNRYSQLNAPGTEYTFPFMQGVGHTTKPTLAELMASLLSDAQTVIDTRSFDEWASDLGYDPDSRKAEKLYQQVVDNNAKLCKLFRTTDLAEVYRKAEPLLEAAGLR